MHIASCLFKLFKNYDFTSLSYSLHASLNYCTRSLFINLLSLSVVCWNVYHMMAMKSFMETVPMMIE